MNEEEYLKSVEEYNKNVKKRSINLILVLGCLASSIGCIGFANMVSYNLGAGYIAGGLAIASSVFSLGLAFFNKR